MEENGKLEREHAVFRGGLIVAQFKNVLSFHSSFFLFWFILVWFGFFPAFFFLLFSCPILFCCRSLPALTRAARRSRRVPRP
jgi:hypothetical protein